MDRAEKQQEVQNLEGKFAKAAIAICADARGLTVAQVTTLRKRLFEKGVKARVVKNTLARLAVKSANKDVAAANQPQLEKFVDTLAGPSFIIFSDSDVVAPAKVAFDFGKDNEKFQIKGAWFEEKFLDKSGVEELSKMPSREETLAKLLALINTPATQLLRLMKEPGTQVARVIGAQKDKLEAGSK